MSRRRAAVKSQEVAEPVDAYMWDRPFLQPNGMVWVRTSTSLPYGQWKLMDAKSERAERYRRLLSLSVTFAVDCWALNEWLLQHREYVFRRCMDIGDLPVGYTMRDNDAPLVRLEVSRITPTQETVNAHIVWHYIRYGSHPVYRDRPRGLKKVYDESEPDGRPPYGVQFSDTPVLLIDGHHRYAAALFRRMTHFDLNLQVCDVAIASVLRTELAAGS